MTAWRWYNGTPATDIESFLSEQKSYYHDEFELMRTYFQKRSDYAIESMRNYLGISNEKKFITVEVDGSGIISVNSVDTELSNKTWAGLFESGKEITLTAKPAEGYTFDGWSGAVNSDSDTITVTADKALSLVCSFKMKEYQYGDTDMDGTINVADLLIMSKYLHGKESFAKMQFLLADMNQDDTVDVFDLLCLREELLK